MLTMLENLQKDDQNKIPLWKLAEQVKHSEYDCTTRLRNFALAFRSNRDLKNSVR